MDLKFNKYTGGQKFMTNLLTILKYSFYTVGIICIAVGIADKVIKKGGK